ncbi:DeoR/GlpR family DNA-binding transcription regulator [Terrabacter sp. MAHUQ-38]|uniref:DeoR/GlpR family DNA-binding transcription regulator n=1 Tax=unclassified Terrabacter TaxID=2630222 RepID=UPI00165D867E|nr:DeoR/GlpR transcriptional regulator [Terrabacter sp. MAHUQ-38]
MLPAQRRSAIVEFVDHDGGVRITDLVDRFGVSEITIRRDIDHLSALGLLERVHGGAMALHRAKGASGFRSRSSRCAVEKRAIAEMAAELVRPGGSIGISGGTTTYELATAICAVPDLTVVTNSVPVAQLLHRAATPGQVVVLTGGVRTESDVLGGPVAVEAVRSMQFDLLFISAHGVDFEAGLTTNDLVEAETNRALVDRARRTCVLADHSKFGVIGVRTFLDLTQAHLLVTDSGVPAAARTALSQAISDLRVASTTGQ